MMLKEVKLERRKLRRENQKRGANYSNELKDRITKHEKIVFDYLTEKKVIFKFQKLVYSPFCCYILDFYFKSLDGIRYAIEIDGKSHELRQEYDKNRTWWLKKKRRITVLRFTNSEVETNIEDIYKTIQSCKPQFYE